MSQGSTQNKTGSLQNGDLPVSGIKRAFFEDDLDEQLRVMENMQKQIGIVDSIHKKRVSNRRAQNRKAQVKKQYGY